MEIFLVIHHLFFSTGEEKGKHLHCVGVAGKKPVGDLAGQSSGIVIFYTVDTLKIRAI